MNYLENGYVKNRFIPFASQCEPSLPIAGDVIDNDCDGLIDEEKKDGIDNDGDGKVDEDLSLVIYSVPI